MSLPPAADLGSGLQLFSAVREGLFFGICGALLVPMSLTAQEEDRAAWTPEPPTKIVGSERCGDCHISEFGVWSETPHAVGLRTLHRKDSASEVARRMGFRLIKRESLCLKCHYTATVDRDQLRGTSGVSCESCHGAAADWIDIHNDYGLAEDGSAFNHRTEPAEHRRQRIERSVLAGMRRPSDLYGVVASCYECHTVQNERLVNDGGHTSGSGWFELVESSQGTIRHNFLDSFRTGDGTLNAESSAEHKRILYVVGRALELEYSLRGAAKATVSGLYLKSMIGRSRAAVSELREIFDRADSLAEVGEMLAEVRGVRLAVGNGEKLELAALRVGLATRRLIANHEGLQLASLDPLVEGTADFEVADTALPADSAIAGVPESVADRGDTGSADESAETAAGAMPTRGRSGSAPSAGAGEASGIRTLASTSPGLGPIKTRIRPRSPSAVLGGSNCSSSCHEVSNVWWVDDAHFYSADPFFEERPDNVAVARLYGISPSDMLRGNQVCMDCHGTIRTGRESREVSDGVSCENCHGAAGDYLEHHQEGDKALGAARPGYVAALQLGMTELRNLENRARTCSGCHLVTEPRLISAGHPTGESFDYVGGMLAIKHWEHPLAPTSELQTAVSAVLASRGPVPRPRPIAETVTTGTSSVASAVASSFEDTIAAVSGTAGGGRTIERKAQRPAVPRPRPRSRTATAGVGESGGFELDLPSLPAVGEVTSVDDVLLLVKERLEELYRVIKEK